MKKVFAIVVALILCFSIFIFTACNDEYIGIEGTITDKEHTKAYTTIQVVYTGKTFISYPIHHPESWRLVVEYDIDGKKKTTTYSVTEEEYNSYKIGDMYIYNGEQEQ